MKLIVRDDAEAIRVSGLLVRALNAVHRDSVLHDVEKQAIEDLLANIRDYTVTVADVNE